MRRLKWTALVCAGAALGISCPAYAGTLDQQQTAYGDVDLGLNGADRVAAQTFTAGQTGQLDQVDLPVGYNEGCQPAGDLIIQIQTVADDLPSGTVLASASLASSAMGEQAGPLTEFVSVAFPSPASVTAGTPYAIVLLAPQAGECEVVGQPGVFETAYYEWQLGADNPYPPGAAHFSFSGGATWSAAWVNDDAGFRTYVAPPGPGADTDPPETTITKDVKRSKTGKVKLRFESDEAAATFECKLKGKDLKRRIRQFNDCDSPQRYKNLNQGRYKFKVRAIDAAGNLDPTPAKDGFRVLD